MMMWFERNGFQRREIISCVCISKYFTLKDNHKSEVLYTWLNYFNSLDLLDCPSI